MARIDTTKTRREKGRAKYVGHRFGQLLVTDYLPGSTTTDPQLICACDCGNTTTARVSHVTSGATRSCGCQQIYKTIHGLTEAPEYSIWSNIKRRCYVPQCKEYKFYGARGIRMSDEWEASFAAFYADMGPRPSEQHSIERRDNNKNYEAGNCYWLLRNLQNRNRRDTVYLTFQGKTQGIRDWADELGISVKMLYNRRYRGWTVEQMLTTPSLPHRGPARKR